MKMCGTPVKILCLQLKSDEKIEAIITHLIKTNSFFVAIYQAPFTSKDVVNSLRVSGKFKAVKYEQQKTRVSIIAKKIENIATKYCNGKGARLQLRRLLLR